MALAAVRSVALDSVWNWSRLEVKPLPGGARVRARVPWWAWLGLGSVQVVQWWKLRRRLRSVERLVGFPFPCSARVL